MSLLNIPANRQFLEHSQLGEIRSQGVALYETVLPTTFRVSADSWTRFAIEGFTLFTPTTYHVKKCPFRINYMPGVQITKLLGGKQPPLYLLGVLGHFM